MRKFLLYSSALAVLGLSGVANAACIQTPTCSSLGYTSTSSCTGGTKCPFGNAWNCTAAELSNNITDITNKITELEKQVVVNPSQGEVCVIGSILYSDKSCYLNAQKGKTPIGIVVYINDNGGGQAMALKSIGNYRWGPSYGDLSTLPNYNSSDAASKDYDSCGNTEKIMVAGDKTTYPAAWAANEYSTEGTSAGDWCLPAAGIFTSYYNNQTAVNLGFERVKGVSFTSETRAWSTSEYYYGYIGKHTVFVARFSYSNGLSYYNQNENIEVRPVLEF